MVIQKGKYTGKTVIEGDLFFLVCEHLWRDNYRVYIINENECDKFGVGELYSGFTHQIIFDCFLLNILYGLDFDSK